MPRPAPVFENVANRMMRIARAGRKRLRPVSRLVQKLFAVFVPPSGGLIPLIRKAARWEGRRRSRRRVRSKLLSLYNVGWFISGAAGKLKRTAGWFRNFWRI